jgi:long-subunit fatty acid transport protein
MSDILPQVGDVDRCQSDEIEVQAQGQANPRGAAPIMERSGPTSEPAGTTQRLRLDLLATFTANAAGCYCSVLLASVHQCFRLMVPAAIGSLWSGIALLPNDAQSSPRSDPTNGAAVFTGASTRHPAGLLLNPATLGLGTTTTFYAATTISLDRLSTVSRVDAAMPSNSKATDISPSPGIDLSYSTHLNDKLAVGAHAFSPPAEIFFSTDKQTQLASTGGRQRDYGVAAGLSYRISRTFYIGVNFSLMRKSLTMGFARDTAAAGGRDPQQGIGSDCAGTACGLNNPLAAQQLNIQASADIFSSTSIAVGALFRITPTMWLGAAYHTPPGFNIFTKFTGSINVTDAPRDGGSESSGGVQVSAQYPAYIETEFRAVVSPMWELHVGGRWYDLSRFAAFDVRPYGVADNTPETPDVPQWIRRGRGLHDEIGVWLGFEEVELGDAWRFGGRLGFESGAVSNENTTVTAPYAPSGLVQIGAQVRLGPAWTLDLHAGANVFVSRTVNASNHRLSNQVECADQEFDYLTASCQATREGFGDFDGNGDYQRIQASGRLGLRYEY